MVLTIQALPAIITKLVLPHAIHLKLPLPSWTRPVALTLGWTITTTIAYLTPPNVPPPIRIFTVVFASFLSAAGDVFWLSDLRAYGKTGLQGWGAGTAAGLVLGAVLPYWMTVIMGAFFRNTIPYLSFFVFLLAVAQLIILPHAPLSPIRTTVGSLRKHDWDDSADEVEETTSFLVQDDPLTPPVTNTQRLQSNLRVLSTLAYPFILPLLLCSAGQAMTYSGFSRAMATNPSFERYTAYLAAYGLVFQLGNLIGRSSLLFSRVPVPGTRTLISAMAISAAAVLLNAAFLVASSTVVVFPLVFAVGVSVGLVYVETFAAILEKAVSLSVEKAFSLGAVGVGESAGLFLGGLVGYVLERTLCGLEVGSGQRWCDTTR